MPDVWYGDFFSFSIEVGPLPLTEEEYEAMTGVHAHAKFVSPPIRQAAEQAAEQTVEADASEDDFVSGWFCIRTDPWPCPADGCGFVADFVTAAHLVVVWPERDDRDLLTYARDCREVGRNPRVVEYEPDFGRCVPYDVWDAAGRPVHGIREPPADWDLWRKRL